MSHSLEPGSFEDFLRWLTERDAKPSPRSQTQPTAGVVEAAGAAWRDFRAVQSSHRTEFLARVRRGNYYEEVEVLAAADAASNRFFPRLRTPNGFVVSALYTTDSAPGTAPVAVLVECPHDLVDVFRGLKVRVLCAGRWVELGEIDVDGKAVADLPEGVEFKPPLGLRVGALEERPDEFRDSDAPR